MKLAIMQPYLFPYLGYFQLINAVDSFVIYDNIEYSKKGWINKNRILLNRKDQLFTVPLKKDSDYLNVNQRYLSTTSSKEINKILGQIKSSYIKAPFYNQAFPIIEHIFLQTEKNLFKYIFNSLNTINEYLGINTRMILSSTIDINHSLKGKHKVIELCKSMNAEMYINPIGGVELYNKDEFRKNDIMLQFHKMNEIVYNQGYNDFIKSLSIIDVIMFNSQGQLKCLLDEFSLT